ncbi:MAG: NAD-dependent epimerase/dehydratase family protein [Dehalococcoidia bacterium]
MKVVVTGGAGFIGHHLVQRLVCESHDVTVLDNLHRGRADWPELHQARFVRGDIRDSDSCLEAFAGADAVVHLAAQSNVMGSQSGPDYAYSTNVTGTWNVARAASEAGIRHLVFASSREVYGDAMELPVRETAPFSPKNLYGASKVAGEVLLQQLRTSDMQISVLRLSNVIGRGDCGRVVPLWLERARRHAPLTVFGGEQLLDLVPVEVVCAAFLRVLEGGGTAEPLNVGSGKATSILSLANHIIELTRSRSSVEIVPSRGPEVSRYCADISRAREVLGLNPPPEPLACIEADW